MCIRDRYVDGVLKDSNALSGNVKQSADAVYIGNYDIAFNVDMAGELDEVRLWNVARTQSQLLATMNDTLAPGYYSTADSGLIGYWRFDQLEDLGVNKRNANDVRDFSINGYHGDLRADATIVSSNVFSGFPIIFVSPSSLNFGNLSVNNTVTQFITVKNIGNDTLHVGPISISGTNPTNFTVNTTPFTLGPSDSLNLDVSFTPDVESSFDASLSIESDGGNTSVFLSGIGISNTIPFAHNHDAGWNLVCLPVIPENTHYLALHPEAVENTLFAFESGYVLKDSMEVGVGYWLQFSQTGIDTLEGQPVDSVTIDLSSGWNMIAGPSCDMLLSSIDDPGDIIISGTLFGFNGSYFLADTVHPGQGYWIQTTAPGQITLECGVTTTSSLTKQDALRNLTDFPFITVEDAAGFSQDLFFNVEFDVSVDLRSFSLPPLAPGIGFDARFAGGYWAVGGDEAVVELHSGNYPISINLSGMQPNDDGKYIIQEMIGTKVIKNHVIQAGEAIQIHNPWVSKLKLTRFENVFPYTFSVEQNYPNPFNPTTQIRYGLPKTEKVELTVFNALGQKVKTLIFGFQEAGYHTVTWDGANEAGQSVSSGIYFYKIEAGHFRQVHKMLLVR